MWQNLVTNIHENWKSTEDTLFGVTVLFSASFPFEMPEFSLFQIFFLFSKTISCHFLHPALFVVCPKWVSLSYVHCISHYSYCAPWLMCCLLLLSFSRCLFFIFIPFESRLKAVHVNCEMNEWSRWIRQMHKAIFMLSFVYNLLQGNYVLFDSGMTWIAYKRAIITFKMRDEVEEKLMMAVSCSSFWLNRWIW